MKAIKPVNAGEELFNDYGPLPRSDLLRRYGYITDNYTQYDVAEIPLSLVRGIATEAGILFEDRLEYLDEQDMLETGYDISTSEPFSLQESLSLELIIIVETLLLPADEYERLKRKGKVPKPGNMSANGAKFLHRLVQTRIQQYPTSLEDDMTLVAQPPAGDVTRKTLRCAMARQVRIGEKKILRETELHLLQLIDQGETNGSLKRGAEEGGNEPEKRRVKR